MTEWDGLRAELHAPLGEQAGRVDLEAVIRAGRRLRWRRRLAAVGTAAAVLAAAATVPALHRSLTPDPPPVAAVAPAGDFIHTGDPNGRVFLLETGPDGRLRLGTGWELDASVMMEGTAAPADPGLPDREPGFHRFTLAGEESMVFGYYVGPVASITATIDGAPHTAGLRRWSGDPAIVVFWFPDVTSPAPVVTELRAFDVDGKPVGSAG